MTEETVTFNLELNVEKAFDSSRRIELVLFRALGLWNRICRMMGVPDDSPAVKVVQKVQEVVMVVRQLHTAAILLETASGPIGWAMAGIGVVGAAITTGDFIMNIGE